MSPTRARPDLSLAVALAATVISVIVLVTACSSDPATQAEVPATGEPTVHVVSTFSTEVLPVVERVCARCHTGEGPGTVHLPMDTAGAVAQAASFIGAAVRTGAMPPWPASDLSVAFHGDWSLTEAEQSAIAGWASEGAMLDVDPTHPITADAGVPRLAAPDIEMRPDVGFGGAIGQPDEYRCMVYDPELVADSWVQGFEFVPDQAEVVHHAIGYLIPASRRDAAIANDAADDQPGWSCFGSSGLGEDSIFLGWAPGQGATELPEGSGLPMAAGDFIVVQIHYHFDAGAPADRSTLRLDLAEDGMGEIDPVIVAPFYAPAEIPCSVGEEGPLCDREAAMARAVQRYGPGGVQANAILAACGASVAEFAAMTDGVASSSCDQRVGITGTVVSLLGHEHELGASFRMTLHPDTLDEVVLLDIPAWSFDWQFAYRPVEEIHVAAGDVVRIECSWDRTLRDPALEPAYVMWADGTNDEMCFATMSVRVDRAADVVADRFFGWPEDSFDAGTWGCIHAAVGADGDARSDAVAAAMITCASPDAVGAAAASAVLGRVRVTFEPGEESCMGYAYAADMEAVAGLIGAGTAEPPAGSHAAAATPFGSCLGAGRMLQRLSPETELGAASLACLDAGGQELVVGVVTMLLGGPTLLGLPTVLFECLTPDEIQALLSAFGGVAD